MQYNDGRIKALVDISTMITTTDNFFEIKDAIIEKMLEVIVPAKACVNLFMKDYQYAHLVCSATLSYIPKYFERNEKGEHHIPFSEYPSYIHQAIKERKVIWIKDIFKDERAERERDLARYEGYRSRAVFPLISSNEVIGFMTCFFLEDSSQYTEEDINFISSVASLVGLSVEITKKKRDVDFMIKKLRGSLNFINKATDELYRNLRLDKFLKLLSKQICNVTFSKDSFIMMKDSKIDVYHESSYGENKDLKKVADQVHSKLRKTKKKIINGKYFNEKHLPTFIKKAGVKSILYHQLIKDDEEIGYIVAANAPCYTEDDLKILNIFATQIMFAIERYNNAAALIEHKMMEKELELVQQQQRLIMPKNNITLSNRTTISYYFQPTANLGGDFCDIFFIDDNRICIFIADVMGHSIMSNYFAAMIKGALKTSIKQEKRAGEILTEINEILYEDFNSLEIYATAKLALYNTETHSISVANAGHHFPIGIRKNGERIVAEEIIFSRGLPLGVFKDTIYKEDFCDVSIYELICMFTDGIIEASDPRGNMFGIDRLKEILVDCYEETNDVISEKIRQALYEHTKKDQPEDDTILIVMKNNDFN